MKWRHDTTLWCGIMTLYLCIKMVTNSSRGPTNLKFSIRETISLTLSKEENFSMSRNYPFIMNSKSFHTSLIQYSHKNIFIQVCTGTETNLFKYLVFLSAHAFFHLTPSWFLSFSDATLAFCQHGERVNAAFLLKQYHIIEFCKLYFMLYPTEGKNFIKSKSSSMKTLQKLDISKRKKRKFPD